MSLIRSTRRVASTLMVAMSTVAMAVAGPLATAQSIFKCVDGETTAYQSMPCGNGQTEVRLTTVARAPDETQAQSIPAASKVESAVPAARSRGKMWPPRRTLMLGMSDDEVLNLPGWGVPEHITRTKGPREWREEWTYGPTANGERRLYFVNATLVDATIDVPAPPQLAIIERKPYPAS